MSIELPITDEQPTSMGSAILDRPVPEAAADVPVTVIEPARGW